MKITIIGAGKLGVMLAKTLTAENHDITIIDINEDRVGKLVEMLDVVQRIMMCLMKLI